MTDVSRQPIRAEEWGELEKTIEMMKALMM
jgi:hypothetical protein